MVWLLQTREWLALMLYTHYDFTRYPRTGDRNMAEQGALLIMIPMKVGDIPLSSAYIHTYIGMKNILHGQKNTYYLWEECSDSRICSKI